jgi:hypothetical protein|tara:strand:+ start:606 stop:743 length:138 start_codon:yes stop_codon:yes gene_type:complete
VDCSKSTSKTTAPTQPANAAAAFAAYLKAAFALSTAKGFRMAGCA